VQLLDGVWRADWSGGDEAVNGLAGSAAAAGYHGQISVASAGLSLDLG
jgi:hypothetical protein